MEKKCEDYRKKEKKHSLQEWLRNIIMTNILPSVTASLFKINVPIQSKFPINKSYTLLFADHEISPINWFRCIIVKVISDEAE